jgi:hypothetical protein
MFRSPNPNSVGGYACEEIYETMTGCSRFELSSLKHYVCHIVRSNGDYERRDHSKYDSELTPQKRWLCCAIQYAWSAHPTPNGRSALGKW